MKVEGRRTYRQGQVYSKRRLSSLKAGILYRPLVCVRHVNRIWDLGLYRCRKHTDRSKV